MELINTVIRGVDVQINLERRLERGEALDVKNLVHADVLPYSIIYSDEEVSWVDFLLQES